jgi:hypothetical protein
MNGELLLALLGRDLMGRGQLPPARRPIRPSPTCCRCCRCCRCPSHLGELGGPVLCRNPRNGKLERYVLTPQAGVT